MKEQDTQVSAREEWAEQVSAERQGGPGVWARKPQPGKARGRSSVRAAAAAVVVVAAAATMKQSSPSLLRTRWLATATGRWLSLKPTEGLTTSRSKPSPGKGQHARK